MERCIHGTAVVSEVESQRYRTWVRVSKDISFSTCRISPCRRAWPTHGRVVANGAVHRNERKQHNQRIQQFPSTKQPPRQQSPAIPINLRIDITYHRPPVTPFQAVAQCHPTGHGACPPQRKTHWKRQWQQPTWTSGHQPATAAEAEAEEAMATPPRLLPRRSGKY